MFHSVPPGLLSQNENGPCPLLALCNVLLLSERMKIPPGETMVSSTHLLDLLGACLIENGPKVSSMGYGNTSSMGCGNVSSMGCGSTSSMGYGNTSSMGCGNVSSMGYGSTSSMGYGNMLWPRTSLL